MNDIKAISEQIFGVLPFAPGETEISPAATAKQAAKIRKNKKKKQIRADEILQVANLNQQ